MPNCRQSDPEIDLDGLRSHLLIEFTQNGYTNRFVTDFDDLVDTPIAIYGTARGENCAQSVLEPPAIAGALTDSDISAQAKKGTAPVSSTPSGCEIKAAVVRLRLTLGETVDEVGPCLFRCQYACAGTGDRFHVSRQPLLEPMVLLREGGKRKVDHLVRKKPVILETIDCGVASKRNRDKRATPAKSPSASWSSARARCNTKCGARDRELPIIRRDGASRGFNPLPGHTPPDSGR